MAGKSETEDLLRARFKELVVQRDAIRAEAEPHRTERDRLQGEIDPLVDKQRNLADVFKEIEKPLFDIDNEIGTISRALKGNTADPVKE